MFMKFLLEYKNYFFDDVTISYKEGDLILVKYWYNKMVTPVKITDVKENHYKVSHNITDSQIQNAPDELIEKKKVIGLYRV